MDEPLPLATNSYSPTQFTQYTLQFMHELILIGYALEMNRCQWIYIGVVIITRNWLKSTKYSKSADKTLMNNSWVCCVNKIIKYLNIFETAWFDVTKVL